MAYLVIAFTTHEEAVEQYTQAWLFIYTQPPWIILLSLFPTLCLFVDSETHKPYI